MANSDAKDELPEVVWKRMWGFHPTLHRVRRPGPAFPKKCIPCGSFVHCRLFTPNFRKFGNKSTLWTLPHGILLVSIPRIMSTYIPTLYGEEKKEEKEKENVF